MTRMTCIIFFFYYYFYAKVRNSFIIEFGTGGVLKSDLIFCMKFKNSYNHKKKILKNNFFSKILNVLSFTKMLKFLSFS